MRRPAAPTRDGSLSGQRRQAYEVPPERLERWLARWLDQHGEPARTEIRPDRVTFRAVDGASVQCEPPFPPLEAVPGERAGFDPAPLLEHVARERLVGVLLVRLGGHAAGVFEGRRLIASKVGSRQVHGRHRAGGSSQRRFERRRGEQARAALQDAADTAARILLPYLKGTVPRRGLEGTVPCCPAEGADRKLKGTVPRLLVLGGDRRALATVMEDARLRPLAPLVSERVLDVPDPRLDVLRATPDAFLATILRPD